MKQLICILLLALLYSSPLRAAESLQETTSLLASVQSGEMPPIEQRIPQEPEVVKLAAGMEPGLQGGQMRLLMGKQKDIRQMVIYGYARLVGYTPELTLKPDLLKSIDVIDNRIFTLHLRKGHRWSDGHPFTSEDFRYYWEDMANNPELAKSGPPPALLVDGEKPVVEFLE